MTALPRTPVTTPDGVLGSADTDPIEDESQPLAVDARTLSDIAASPCTEAGRIVGGARVLFSAIWRSNLPDNDKAVLFFLLERASDEWANDDPHHAPWVLTSLRELAADAGIDESNTNLSPRIARFVAWGILSRENAGKSMRLRFRHPAQWDTARVKTKAQATREDRSAKPFCTRAQCESDEHWAFVDRFQQLANEGLQPTYLKQANGWLTENGVPLDVLLAELEYCYNRPNWRFLFGFLAKHMTTRVLPRIREILAARQAQEDANHAHQQPHQTAPAASAQGNGRSALRGTQPAAISELRGDHRRGNATGASGFAAARAANRRSVTDTQTAAATK